MTDLLYRWPRAAEFGARVPKKKFYEYGAITNTVRDIFVSEVQRITWAYKLAETTINLPSTAAVPEVQVFALTAKNDDVSPQVITAIDRTIPFPIIFEVTRNYGVSAEVRMVAAYKQIGEGNSKLSPYFSTDWQSIDTERSPLPTALDLSILYTKLFEGLTQTELPPGETISETAERLKTIGTLEREIAMLKRKLNSERQFNRKVELHRLLNTKQSLLNKQR